MAALTLEDIVAAARCVALWGKLGVRPLRAASWLKRAVARAAAYRQETGLVHPTLGDGSLSAAAASLSPCRGQVSRILITPGDLLDALAPVSVVLGQGAAALG
jgi:hypothetical protein